MEITDKGTPLSELTLSLGLCDVDTVYHCLRVGKLSRLLMEEYIRQYSPEVYFTPRMLEWAATLHDIGKSRVPLNVLLKTSSLTPEELTDVKRHVIHGKDILKEHEASGNELLRRLANEVVTYHHERADGSGYPEGRKDDEIPLSAQIVSIADCFDALVGARSYKPPISAEKATEMIIDGKCGYFSEKILSCLLAVEVH